jgi:SPP1 family phage portal protein
MDLIKKCFEQLNLNIAAKTIYDKYYRGIHDIYDNYARLEARSNDIVIKNCNKEFINKYVSYLLSKPVNYISRDLDTTDADLIKLSFSPWETLHNQELLRYCLIFGESYELNYINKDKEFGALALNPLNGFVLEDGTADRNVLLGMHFYYDAMDSVGTLTNTIKKYLDVYTDKEVIKYDVTDLQIGKELSRKEHNFNRVPMRILRLDSYAMANLEDYKTELDAYCTTLSNLSNECNDFRNATLFSKRLNIKKDADGSGNTDEYYQDVIDKGWVNSSDKDSDMKYVTKEIGSFVNDLLDKLKEDIFSSASMVDEVKTPTSNTSGEALRQRLHALEDKVSLMASPLEFILKQRLKLFFEYQYKLTGTKFEYRGIGIKFTLNIPKEITTLSNAIPNLLTIFPRQRILSMFGDVENPELVYKQWLKEQEAEVNGNENSQYNFDANNNNSTNNGGDAI